MASSKSSTSYHHENIQNGYKPGETLTPPETGVNNVRERPSSPIPINNQAEAKRREEKKKLKKLRKDPSVGREVSFIVDNFCQRVCKNFSPISSIRHRRKSRKDGHSSKETSGNWTRCLESYCKCGLEKKEHTVKALNNTSETWDSTVNTKTTLCTCFGNLQFLRGKSESENNKDIKKYIRIDDAETDPKTMITFLAKDWGMEEPELIISVVGTTSRRFKQLNYQKGIQRVFRLLAATKRTWIITDGLQKGSSGFLGKMLNKLNADIKNEKSKIKLIGVTPWNRVENRSNFEGIHVGNDNATYECKKKPGIENSGLDPNHHIYLLTDDGTLNKGKWKPGFRERLETEDMKTHLLVLAIGELDVRTLEKLSKLTEANKIQIIMYSAEDDSGSMMTRLNTVYKKLETAQSKCEEKGKRACESYDGPAKVTSPKEEKIFKNNSFGLEEYGLFKRLMEKRHLISFVETGVLFKPILEKAFPVADQHAALELFYEIVFDGLMMALLAEEEHLVRSLIVSNDKGNEIHLRKFLTLNRLYDLYKDTLEKDANEKRILKKLLRGSQNHEEDQENLLPRVGRMLHLLLGDSYKLMYQEDKFRKTENNKLQWSKPLFEEKEEMAVWHLFLWAVLRNKTGLAGVFHEQSRCKIGAALVACKLLNGLADTSKHLWELEAQQDFKDSAEQYENEATDTINNMYKKKREEAYSMLITVLPFQSGKYITPLSIAADAKAMDFMNTSCCQTFIQRVWISNMKLDTPRWKLFPLWGPVVAARRCIDISTTTMYLGGEEDIGTKTKSVCFHIKNYCTAPVTTAYLHGIAYILFLGIFTRFVLSDLGPFHGITDMTPYEWLVIIWVASLTVSEIRQIFWPQKSDPFEELKDGELLEKWDNTWKLYERVRLKYKIYHISAWFENFWNKVDLLMITFAITAFVLRFTLHSVDIGLVRAVFAITLIAFYFRLLRIPYVLNELGPWIITIIELVKDLLRFMAVLSVVIISFGVALQAVLDPVREPSWSLVISILWRPYWQMYGEYFLDDASTEMGRPVEYNQTCTYDRELAKTNPETLVYCYEWIPVVMLAVFVLVTNIMLLNLLIAIFNTSYQEIHAKSGKIWRFHLYDLVHEFYFATYLPPPLNIFEILLDVCWYIHRRRRPDIPKKKSMFRQEKQSDSNHICEKAAYEECKTYATSSEKKRSMARRAISRLREVGMDKHCYVYISDSDTDSSVATDEDNDFDTDDTSFGESTDRYLVHSSTSPSTFFQDDTLFI